MCELTYMLIFVCSKVLCLYLDAVVYWLSSLGLLLHIIYIVLSYRLTIQFHLQCPRPKSFAQWRIFQRSISGRDCSHPWSWVRLRRNRVHFPNHTHIVSNDACVGLVQWSISDSEDSHPEVELGLTGLTSTSWYIRTTRSESLAVYQSSGSVLGVRPRILF